MIEESALQYLCLLPLPLTAPGLNARLGGIIVKRVSSALLPVGTPEFLKVRLPAHQLPNPVYLLKQQLHPSLFTSGSSEYELQSVISDKCEPEHVLPVTFGFKYLFYLEALQLRCFKDPPLFEQKDLLDLKVVLQAARLFGSLQQLRADALSSLAAAAAALKFKAPEGLVPRVGALPFLLSYLKQYDAPILQFCLKGRAERVRRLQQSLTQGSLVILADGTHFAAARCLNLDAQHAELLCCAPDLSVSRRTLRLAEPNLIAPQGILTSPRQEHLRFSLKQAADVLEQALPKADKLPDSAAPSVRDQLFAKLSAEEQRLYHETGTLNPQLLPRPPLTVSDFFKELLFLYQADNFTECLVQSELDAYRDFCRRKLMRSAARYVKETQAAASLLAEDDEKAQALFLEIAKFPQTL